MPWNAAAAQSVLEDAVAMAKDAAPNPVPNSEIQNLFTALIGLDVKNYIENIEVAEGNHEIDRCG